MHTAKKLDWNITKKEHNMNASKRNTITKIIAFGACLLALITISTPSFAWQILMDPNQSCSELGPGCTVLDVDGAHFKVGAEIDSAYYNDSSAQNWSFTINQALSKEFGYSIFTLEPAFSPTLCLTPTPSWTGVTLTACAGSTPQLWFYQEGDGGAGGIPQLINFGYLYYYGASALCVDVRGDSWSPGTVVDLDLCNDTYAQAICLPSGNYCDYGPCGASSPIVIRKL